MNKLIKIVTLGIIFGISGVSSTGLAQDKKVETQTAKLYYNKGEKLVHTYNLKTTGNGTNSKVDYWNKVKFTFDKNNKLNPVGKEYVQGGISESKITWNNNTFLGLNLNHISENNSLFTKNLRTISSSNEVIKIDKLETFEEYTTLSLLKGNILDINGDIEFSIRLGWASYHNTNYNEPNVFYLMYNIYCNLNNGHIDATINFNLGTWFALL